MPAKKNHIIQKQSIGISFENLNDAVGIQNRIAEVFYERLQPQMELLFDEMIGEKYFVATDRLEIDAGILSSEKWEEEWVENVLHQLKEELLAVDKRKINQGSHDHSQVDESVTKQTEIESTVQSFLFFLRHGYFPWNNRAQSLDEIEKNIIINDSLVIRLKKLFIDHRRSAERLAFQFSETFRQRIMEVLVAGREEHKQGIFMLLRENRIEINKRSTDAALFYAFSISQENNITREFFAFVYDEVKGDKKSGIKKILEQIAPATNDEGSPKQEEVARGKKKDIKKEDEAKEDETGDPEDIYISNAGLVIVHPFLPQLFEEIGLSRNGQWENENAPHIAACVLEFIARGIEGFPEFNLPLNKILCGIELNETTRAGEEISDRMKETCNNLLEEVIKHWSVLKNSSVDGLRETFFQRNGKLVVIDNGWLLQVEQKAFDVLLQQLPWGIGTIRLPWMKGLLHVEWC